MYPQMEYSFAISTRRKTGNTNAVAGKINM